MASADVSADKARGKQAVERAMNGDLARGGSYSLNYDGSYRMTLPPTFFTNVDTEPGDKGKVFMDFQNEAIVICYGGDDGDEK
jgi:hypothetical protein